MPGIERPSVGHLRQEMPEQTGLQLRLEPDTVDPHDVRAAFNRRTPLESVGVKNDV